MLENATVRMVLLIGALLIFGVLLASSLDALPELRSTIDGVFSKRLQKY